MSFEIDNDEEIDAAEIEEEEEAEDAADGFGFFFLGEEGE